MPLSKPNFEMLDAVTRAGSFSGAALILNKVPSAISHSVKQLEDELGIVIFERHHRKITLTPAGKFLTVEARAMLKKMEQIEIEVRNVANGWQPTLTIAVDAIVRTQQMDHLIADFCKAFDDVELRFQLEVYNGVWDSLASGRSDIAIGATTAIPVDGAYDYKDMGAIDWAFVVGRHHPLASPQHGTDIADITQYPSICLDDTSRAIPRRTTWLLPGQRRLVVPNWDVAVSCAQSGVGIGYFPTHKVRQLLTDGALVEKQLKNPKPPSNCCLAWSTECTSPAFQWALKFLGDQDRLRECWISGVDRQPKR
mgnify:CR=1 FL=1